MCVMCYIGLKSEIKEIEFNQDKPAFCIERMQKSDFDAKTFSSPNIYWVGSSAGCGCGFGVQRIPENIISEVRAFLKNKKKIPDKYRNYFEYEDTIEEVEDTIKENKEFAEDTEKLYSLICEQSENNDIIEFFGCWSGREKEEFDKIKQVKLSAEKLDIDFGEMWNLNVKMIIEK